MTDKDFQKAMERLRRRMQMLELAKQGSAEVHRVKVKSYTVREHSVRAHTRVYYRLKKEI